MAAIMLLQAIFTSYLMTIAYSSSDSQSHYNTTKTDQNPKFTLLTNLDPQPSNKHLIFDEANKKPSPMYGIQSLLWNGISVEQEAAKLGDLLREIANSELGVTTIQVGLDSSRLHALNLVQIGLEFLLLI